MNDWIYGGKYITSLEDLSNDDKSKIGFIYRITQKSTGHQYIGKKLLTKAATKTVNGRKKRIRVESDWLTYYSSSPKLLQLISDIGEDDFVREILVFVNSKSELLYAEEYALYMTGAILRDDFFNDNIRSKVYSKWFQKSRDSFTTSISQLSKKINE